MTSDTLKPRPERAPNPVFFYSDLAGHERRAYLVYKEKRELRRRLEHALTAFTIWRSWMA